MNYRSRPFIRARFQACCARLDPHSIFFDPDQNEQLKQMENSERKGFGTVVSILPGRVIILQALPGTPSAKAGLQPGDEIVAVNDVVLARLEFEQVVGYLSESHQHRAQLVRAPAIETPGRSSLCWTPSCWMRPAWIERFYLQPGIGYIRVNGFDPQTAKQLKDAIENLGGEKLKGLVLDLRDNPGGVVQSRA